MILDNETDIPTGLEAEYAERDGKWELQVDGAKSQVDVDKLKKALDAERVITSQLRKDGGKAAELQVELDNKNSIIATFKDGGFDEDKLNQMADERAAGKIQIAQMEKEHAEKAQSDTAARLEAMQQEANAGKIRDAIREAMKTDVRDTAQSIFLQLNERKCTIVDGIVLTNAEVYGSTISVAEFVKSEVAKDPDNFKPISSGGGAGGGKKGTVQSGDNPFKGKGNLTIAAALAKSDPEAAKAAAKAAGLNAYDPRFGAIIKSLG